MYEYTVQELTIACEGRLIYGKLYIPARAGRCPLIILSHGYNGGHPQFEAECRFYAAHGYLAYAFDFCGGSSWSRSSGKSTDMTLLSEKADLLAVLDHLRSMAQVDPARIFLMGGSQGGLVTALAAEERADAVRGVILYFPAMNIPGNWRDKYPDADAIPEVTEFWGLALGRVFFTAMREMQPFEIIGGYKGKVLVITGDQDAIVPLDTASRAAACYAHGELAVLPGEGHGFSPEGSQTAMELSLAMMEKQ